MDWPTSISINNSYKRSIRTRLQRRLAQVLFEKTGLSTQRMHTLRIEVRREKRPDATGNVQQIHGFEVSEAMNYPEVIRQAAEVELKAIVAGTKPYLAPETWKPVAYAATAPAKGVTLEPGLLRECFDRNIAYLNRCFAAPNGTYCDMKKIEGSWLVDLPGSSEGRMLGGAAHTLRWGERADMRTIVDTFVNKVKSRQTADGWCLPYPIADITTSERSNYDRVGLTRGLIAAGMAGNPDAYGILRRFYDWFNTSPYQPTLLRGGNCNNGHEGGLLMYFSPVGKKEDLVAVERYFVQDFFIEQAAQAEPLALDYYPLSKPHSYLILAFQAWLDHYRATGAAKYLDAAKGAWRIINGSYEHIGGTMAICESDPGTFPPKSYYLGTHTGETCGSIFWADFNHRFLQLFPGEAKYADEIENVIYNVILAAQDAKGSIRYHNNLQGNKEGAGCINTCCEVMGVPFIARLPQYIYSVADDGLYVNLFAASSIAWTNGGPIRHVEDRDQFPLRRQGGVQTDRVCAHADETADSDAELGRRQGGDQRQWRGCRNGNARQLCRDRPLLVEQRRDHSRISHGVPSRPLHGLGPGCAQRSLRVAVWSGSDGIGWRHGPRYRVE